MKKQSLEQTKSLEVQIIKKLNKILKNTGLMFEHSELTDAICMSYHGIRDHSWKTLSIMIFGDYNTLSIFEDIHSYEIFDPDEMNEAYKPFIAIGLTCLESCSSLEEVLLKLEVMFPDV